jgi:hypothetical protein
VTDSWNLTLPVKHSFLIIEANIKLVLRGVCVLSEVMPTTAFERSSGLAQFLEQANVKRSRSKTSDGDQRNASKSRSAMPTDLSEKVIQRCLLLKTLKLPICGMRDADTTVGVPRFCVSMDLPDQLPSRHFHAAMG